MWLWLILCRQSLWLSLGSERTWVSAIGRLLGSRGTACRRRIGLLRVWLTRQRCLLWVVGLGGCRRVSSGRRGWGRGSRVLSILWRKLLWILSLVHGYGRGNNAAAGGLPHGEGPYASSADGTDDGVQKQHIIVNEHCEEIEEGKGFHRSDLVANRIAAKTAIREEPRPSCDGSASGCNPQNPEDEEPDNLKKNHRGKYPAFGAPQYKEQREGNGSYGCCCRPEWCERQIGICISLG